jgi:hypothetical protein
MDDFKKKLEQAIDMKNTIEGAEANELHILQEPAAGAGGAGIGLAAAPPPPPPPPPGAAPAAPVVVKAEDIEGEIASTIEEGDYEKLEIGISHLTNQTAADLSERERIIANETGRLVAEAAVDIMYPVIESAIIAEIKFKITNTHSDANILNFSSFLAGLKGVVERSIAEELAKGGDIDAGAIATKIKKAIKRYVNSLADKCQDPAVFKGKIWKAVAPIAHALILPTNKLVREAGTTPVTLETVIKNGVPAVTTSNTLNEGNKETKTQKALKVLKAEINRAPREDLSVHDLTVALLPVPPAGVPGAAPPPPAVPGAPPPPAAVPDPLINLYHDAVAAAAPHAPLQVTPSGVRSLGPVRNLTDAGGVGAHEALADLVSNVSCTAIRDRRKNISDCFLNLTTVCRNLGVNEFIASSINSITVNVAAPCPMTSAAITFIKANPNLIGTVTIAAALRFEQDVGLDINARIDNIVNAVIDAILPDTLAPPNVYPADRIHATYVLCMSAIAALIPDFNFTANYDAVKALFIASLNYGADFTNITNEGTVPPPAVGALPVPSVVTGKAPIPAGSSFAKDLIKNITGDIIERRKEEVIAATKGVFAINYNPPNNFIGVVPTAPISDVGRIDIGKDIEGDDTVRGTTAGQKSSEFTRAMIKNENKLNREQYLLVKTFFKLLEQAQLPNLTQEERDIILNELAQVSKSLTLLGKSLVDAHRDSLCGKLLEIKDKLTIDRGDFTKSLDVTERNINLQIAQAVCLGASAPLIEMKIVVDDATGGFPDGKSVFADLVLKAPAAPAVPAAPPKTGLYQDIIVHVREGIANDGFNFDPEVDVARGDFDNVEVDGLDEAHPLRLIKGHIIRNQQKYQLFTELEKEKISQYLDTLVFLGKKYCGIQGDICYENIEKHLLYIDNFLFHNTLINSHERMENAFFVAKKLIQVYSKYNVAYYDGKLGLNRKVYRIAIRFGCSHIKDTVINEQSSEKFLKLLDMSFSYIKATKLPRIKELLTEFALAFNVNFINHRENYSTFLKNSIQRIRNIVGEYISIGDDGRMTLKEKIIPGVIGDHVNPAIDLAVQLPNGQRPPMDITVLGIPDNEIGMVAPGGTGYTAALGVGNYIKRPNDKHFKRLENVRLSGKIIINSIDNYLNLAIVSSALLDGNKKKCPLSRDVFISSLMDRFNSFSNLDDCENVFKSIEFFLSKRAEQAFLNATTQTTMENSLLWSLQAITMALQNVRTIEDFKRLGGVVRACCLAVKEAKFNSIECVKAVQNFVSSLEGIKMALRPDIRKMESFNQIFRDNGLYNAFPNQPYVHIPPPPAPAINANFVPANFLAIEATNLMSFNDEAGIGNHLNKILLLRNNVVQKDFFVKYSQTCIDYIEAKHPFTDGVDNIFEKLISAMQTPIQHPPRTAEADIELATLGSCSSEDSRRHAGEILGGILDHFTAVITPDNIRNYLPYIQKLLKRDLGRTKSTDERFFAAQRNFVSKVLQVLDNPKSMIGPFTKEDISLKLLDVPVKFAVGAILSYPLNVTNNAADADPNLATNKKTLKNILEYAEFLIKLNTKESREAVVNLVRQIKSAIFNVTNPMRDNGVGLIKVLKRFTTSSLNAAGDSDTNNFLAKLLNKIDEHGRGGDLKKDIVGVFGDLVTINDDNTIGAFKNQGLLIRIGIDEVSGTFDADGDLGRREPAGGDPRDIGFVYQAPAGLIINGPEDSFLARLTEKINNNHGVGNHGLSNFIPSVRRGLEQLYIDNFRVAPAVVPGSIGDFATDNIKQATFEVAIGEILIRITGIFVASPIISDADANIFNKQRQSARALIGVLEFFTSKMLIASSADEIKCLTGSIEKIFREISKIKSEPGVAVYEMFGLLFEKTNIFLDVIIQKRKELEHEEPVKQIFDGLFERLYVTAATQLPVNKVDPVGFAGVAAPAPPGDTDRNKVLANTVLGKTSPFYTIDTNAANAPDLLKEQVIGLVSLNAAYHTKSFYDGCVRNFINLYNAGKITIQLLEEICDEFSKRILIGDGNDLTIPKGIVVVAADIAALNNNANPKHHEKDHAEALFGELLDDFTKKAHAQNPEEGINKLKVFSKYIAAIQSTNARFLSKVNSFVEVAFITLREGRGIIDKVVREEIEGNLIKYIEYNTKKSAIKVAKVGVETLVLNERVKFTREANALLETTLEQVKMLLNLNTKTGVKASIKVIETILSETLHNAGVNDVLNYKTLILLDRLIPFVSGCMAACEGNSELTKKISAVFGGFFEKNNNPNRRFNYKVKDVLIPDMSKVTSVAIGAAPPVETEGFAAGVYGDHPLNTTYNGTFLPNVVLVDNGVNNLLGIEVNHPINDMFDNSIGGIHVGFNGFAKVIQGRIDDTDDDTMKNTGAYIYFIKNFEKLFNHNFPAAAALVVDPDPPYGPDGRLNNNIENIFKVITNYIGDVNPPRVVTIDQQAVATNILKCIIKTTIQKVEFMKEGDEARRTMKIVGWLFNCIARLKNDFSNQDVYNLTQELVASLNRKRESSIVNEQVKNVVNLTIGNFFKNPTPEVRAQNAGHGAADGILHHHDDFTPKIEAINEVGDKTRNIDNLNVGLIRIHNPKALIMGTNSPLYNIVNVKFNNAFDVATLKVHAAECAQLVRSLIRNDIVDDTREFGRGFKEVIERIWDNDFKVDEFVNSVGAEINKYFKAKVGEPEFKKEIATNSVRLVNIILDVIIDKIKLSDQEVTNNQLTIIDLFFNSIENINSVNVQLPGCVEFLQKLHTLTNVFGKVQIEKQLLEKYKIKIKNTMDQFVASFIEKQDLFLQNGSVVNIAMFSQAIATFGDIFQYQIELGGTDQVTSVVNSLQRMMNLVSATTSYFYDKEHLLVMLRLLTPLVNKVILSCKDQASRERVYNITRGFWKSAPPPDATLVLRTDYILKLDERGRLILGAMSTDDERIGGPDNNVAVTTAIDRIRQKIENGVANHPGGVKNYSDISRFFYQLTYKVCVSAVATGPLVAGGGNLTNPFVSIMETLGSDSIFMNGLITTSPTPQRAVQLQHKKQINRAEKAFCHALEGITVYLSSIDIIEYNSIDRLKPLLVYVLRAIGNTVSTNLELLKYSNDFIHAFSTLRERASKDKRLCNCFNSILAEVYAVQAPIRRGAVDVTVNLEEKIGSEEAELIRLTRARAPVPPVAPLAPPVGGAAPAAPAAPPVAIDQVDRNRFIPNWILELGAPQGKDAINNFNPRDVVGNLVRGDKTRLLHLPLTETNEKLINEFNTTLRGAIEQATTNTETGVGFHENESIFEGYEDGCLSIITKLFEEGEFKKEGNAKKIVKAFIEWILINNKEHRAAADDNNFEFEDILVDAATLTGFEDTNSNNYRKKRCAQKIFLGFLKKLSFEINTGNFLENKILIEDVLAAIAVMQSVDGEYVRTTFEFLRSIASTVLASPSLGDVDKDRLLEAISAASNKVTKEVSLNHPVTKICLVDGVEGQKVRDLLKDTNRQIAFFAGLNTEAGNRYALELVELMLDASRNLSIGTDKINHKTIILDRTIGFVNDIYRLLVEKNQRLLKPFERCCKEFYVFDVASQEWKVRREVLFPILDANNDMLISDIENNAVNPPIHHHYGGAHHNVYGRRLYNRTPVMQNLDVRIADGNIDVPSDDEITTIVAFEGEGAHNGQNTYFSKYIDNYIKGSPIRNEFRYYTTRAVPIEFVANPPSADPANLNGLPNAATYPHIATFAAIQNFSKRDIFRVFSALYSGNPVSFSNCCQAVKGGIEDADYTKHSKSIEMLSYLMGVAILNIQNINIHDEERAILDQTRLFSNNFSSILTCIEKCGDNIPNCIKDQLIFIGDILRLKMDTIGKVSKQAREHINGVFGEYFVAKQALKNDQPNSTLGILCDINSPFYVIKPDNTLTKDVISGRYKKIVDLSIENDSEEPDRFFVPVNNFVRMFTVQEFDLTEQHISSCFENITSVLSQGSFEDISASRELYEIWKGEGLRRHALVPGNDDDDDAKIAEYRKRVNAEEMTIKILKALEGEILRLQNQPPSPSATHLLHSLLSSLTNIKTENPRIIKGVFDVMEALKQGDARCKSIYDSNRQYFVEFFLQTSKTLSEGNSFLTNYSTLVDNRKADAELMLRQIERGTIHLVEAFENAGDDEELKKRYEKNIDDLLNWIFDFARLNNQITEDGADYKFDGGRNLILTLQAILPHLQAILKVAHNPSIGNKIRDKYCEFYTVSATNEITINQLLIPSSQDVTDSSEINKTRPIILISPTAYAIPKASFKVDDQIFDDLETFVKEKIANWRETNDRFKLNKFRVMFLKAIGQQWQGEVVASGVERFTNAIVPHITNSGGGTTSNQKNATAILAETLRLLTFRMQTLSTPDELTMLKPYLLRIFKCLADLKVEDRILRDSLVAFKSVYILRRRELCGKARDFTSVFDSIKKDFYSIDNEFTKPYSGDRGHIAFLARGNEGPFWDVNINLDKKSAVVNNIKSIFDGDAANSGLIIGEAVESVRNMYETDGIGHSDARSIFEPLEKELLGTSVGSTEEKKRRSVELLSGLLGLVSREISVLQVDSMDEVMKINTYLIHLFNCMWELKTCDSDIIKGLGEVTNKLAALEAGSFARKILFEDKRDILIRSVEQGIHSITQNSAVIAGFDVGVAETGGKVDDLLSGVEAQFKFLFNLEPNDSHLMLIEELMSHLIDNVVSINTIEDNGQKQYELCSKFLRLFNNLLNEHIFPNEYDVKIKSIMTSSISSFFTIRQDNGQYKLNESALPTSLTYNGINVGIENTNFAQGQVLCNFLQTAPRDLDAFKAMIRANINAHSKIEVDAGGFGDFESFRKTFLLTLTEEGADGWLEKRSCAIDILEMIAAATTNVGVYGNIAHPVQPNALPNQAAAEYLDKLFICALDVVILKLQAVKSYRDLDFIKDVVVATLLGVSKSYSQNESLRKKVSHLTDLLLKKRKEPWSLKDEKVGEVYEYIGYEVRSGQGVANPATPLPPENHLTFVGTPVRGYSNIYTITPENRGANVDVNEEFIMQVSGVISKIDANTPQDDIDSYLDAVYNNFVTLNKNKTKIIYANTPRVIFCEGVVIPPAANKVELFPILLADPPPAPPTQEYRRAHSLALFCAKTIGYYEARLEKGECKLPSDLDQIFGLLEVAVQYPALTQPTILVDEVKKLAETLGNLLARDDIGSDIKAGVLSRIKNMYERDNRPNGKLIGMATPPGGNSLGGVVVGPDSFLHRFSLLATNASNIEEVRTEAFIKQEEALQAVKDGLAETGVAGSRKIKTPVKDLFIDRKSLYNPDEVKARIDNVRLTIQNLLSITTASPDLTVGEKTGLRFQSFGAIRRINDSVAKSDDPDILHFFGEAVNRIAGCTTISLTELLAELDAILVLINLLEKLKKQIDKQAAKDLLNLYLTSKPSTLIDVCKFQVMKFRTTNGRQPTGVVDKGSINIFVPDHINSFMGKFIGCSPIAGANPAKFANLEFILSILPSEFHGVIFDGGEKFEGLINSLFAMDTKDIKEIFRGPPALQRRYAKIFFTTTPDPAIIAELSKLSKSNTVPTPNEKDAAKRMVRAFVIDPENYKKQDVTIVVNDGIIRAQIPDRQGRTFVTKPQLTIAQLNNASSYIEQRSSQRHSLLSAADMNTRVKFETLKDTDVEAVAKLMDTRVAQPFSITPLLQKQVESYWSRLATYKSRASSVVHPALTRQFQLDVDILRTEINDLKNETEGGDFRTFYMQNPTHIKEVIKKICLGLLKIPVPPKNPPRETTAREFFNSHVKSDRVYTEGLALPEKFKDELFMLCTEVVLKQRSSNARFAGIHQECFAVGSAPNITHRVAISTAIANNLRDFNVEFPDLATRPPAGTYYTIDQRFDKIENIATTPRGGDRLDAYLDRLTNEITTVTIERERLSFTPQTPITSKDKKDAAVTAVRRFVDLVAKTKFTDTFGTKETASLLKVELGQMLEASRYSIDCKNFMLLVEKLMADQRDLFGMVVPNETERIKCIWKNAKSLGLSTMGIRGILTDILNKCKGDETTVGMICHIFGIDIKGLNPASSLFSDIATDGNKRKISVDNLNRIIKRCFPSPEDDLTAVPYLIAPVPDELLEMKKEIEQKDKEHTVLESLLKGHNRDVIEFTDLTNPLNYSLMSNLLLRGFETMKFAIRGMKKENKLTELFPTFLSMFKSINISIEPEFLSWFIHEELVKVECPVKTVFCDLLDGQPKQEFFKDYAQRFGLFDITPFALDSKKKPFPTFKEFKENLDKTLELQKKEELEAKDSALSVAKATFKLTVDTAISTAEQNLGRFKRWRYKGKTDDLVAKTMSDIDILFSELNLPQLVIFAQEIVFNPDNLRHVPNAAAADATNPIKNNREYFVDFLRTIYDLGYKLNEEGTKLVRDDEAVEDTKRKLSSLVERSFEGTISQQKDSFTKQGDYQVSLDLIRADPMRAVRNMAIVLGGNYSNSNVCVGLCRLWGFENLDDFGKSLGIRIKDSNNLTNEEAKKQALEVLAERSVARYPNETLALVDPSIFTGKTIPPSLSRLTFTEENMGKCLALAAKCQISIIDNKGAELDSKIERLNAITVNPALIANNPTHIDPKAMLNRLTAERKILGERKSRLDKASHLAFNLAAERVMVDMEAHKRIETSFAVDFTT